MERIQFQWEHLRTSQKLDRILGSVLIISGILRLANNLKENGDIRRIDDQSTIKTINSFVFEEEYTGSISNLDILTLTTSSIFIFFNSFKSKILRFIVQINFLYYIFFCFKSCDIRFITFSNSISVF